MYKLIDASSEDMELLISSKLSTILEYARDLDEEEVKRIHAYVNESVPVMLSEYKVVLVDGKKAGCLLVTAYEDGVMLDEIYLDKACRNRGIGTEIIKEVLSKHDVVYLWVYKENKGARELYRRLGFVEERETETRYFMKYVG